MELFTPDFGLVFWMFIAFGILFLVLWRFAWPVILKSVDSRADLIDKGVEYAQDAKERLDNARREAESYLNEARRQQAEILREADKMKTQIIEEARSGRGSEGNGQRTAPDCPAAEGGTARVPQPSERFRHQHRRQARRTAPAERQGARQARR